MNLNIKLQKIEIIYFNHRNKFFGICNLSLTADDIDAKKMKKKTMGSNKCGNFLRRPYQLSNWQL